MNTMLYMIVDGETVCMKFRGKLEQVTIDYVLDREYIYGKACWTCSR